MLMEYSRSDAEYETCLAAEPSLQACLDKLHRAGHSVFREATDPKLYVEPDLVMPITDELTKEGVLLNGKRVSWQGQMPSCYSQRGILSCSAECQRQSEEEV